MVFTPEMISKMANVATALYATPFKLMARVCEDQNLDLSPEELGGIHAANELGVQVMIPMLGENAPLYFLGACYAAPVLFRADLIYDGIKRVRAKKKLAQHMIASAAPTDTTEKK